MTETKSDIISIIAGGWSLHGFEFSLVPGLKIGVNEASLLVETDIIVSMDRLWTEARWDAIKSRAVPTYIRRSALQNIPDPLPDLVEVFDCEIAKPFTSTPGRLNGSNSGMCAFNLAYQLRPRRIVLFGFDMCRAPDGTSYWYPPYAWAPKGATKPGKYRDWAREFGPAAALCESVGIEVVNASLFSAIPNFPKMKPEEACL